MMYPPQPKRPVDVAAIHMATLIKANYRRATARAVSVWPPQTYREHLLALFMATTRHYNDHRELPMPEELAALLTKMYHCASNGGSHVQMLKEATSVIGRIPALVFDRSVGPVWAAANAILNSR